MLSLLGPCTASSATRLIGSMKQFGERCTDRGGEPPAKAQRASKNATLAASRHLLELGATCTDELATEIEWHAAGAANLRRFPDVPACAAHAVERQARSA
jgi:hypothetical protein